MKRFLKDFTIMKNIVKNIISNVVMTKLKKKFRRIMLNEQAFIFKLVKFK
jgi:hypothetical protein